MFVWWRVEVEVEVSTPRGHLIGLKDDKTGGGGVMAQRKWTTEEDGLFEVTLTNSLHDVERITPAK